MQVKKKQLEPDMEQQTGSKLGKEYVKVVYCYPDYLTYMQSASCEMLGWMYSLWESFGSSSLATLPLGFNCGFTSTSACGSSIGICS